MKAENKKRYPEYKQAREKMIELLTAPNSVERILGVAEKEKDRDRRQGALVVHPARKQTVTRAEFPHSVVVVLDGRQPACVLRLALQTFRSGLRFAFWPDAPLESIQKLEKLLIAPKARWILMRHVLRQTGAKRKRRMRFHLQSNEIV